MNTPASTGLTNAQIASVVSQLASGATQAAVLSQLPAGYSIGANGAIIPPSTSLIAGVSNTVLIGGVLAVGLLVIVMSKGKK